MYCIALSFLALAGVAAGAGYIPGKEYVYRYQGHVSAGFPDKKPQYAGLAYDTLVHIQPKGEYAVFQITDKKYNTFNGEPRTCSERQPFDHFEELPPRTDYNTPPFKVYFKDGQVTQFQVSKDEPVYSLNIKRALISLFHLTFDHDEPQNLSDRENEIYKPDYGEHYYKTMEDGVLGNCETQYVIEHLPYYKTPHNNIVLNITKTRNYHKCNSSPNHYYSTFYGEDCAESEREKAHTVHANAFYHYDIRGDRHHYIIERVTTEGDFSFTPYPLEGQTAEIFVNRTLELVEVRDAASHEYEVPADLVTYHSLQYDFNYKPKFRDAVDLKQPHYLYHVYGKKVPLEQIRLQVTDLIRVYDDDTYKKPAKERDFPAMFLELVRSVSTLGYEDIEELYKEYADFDGDHATPEQLLTKNLFFDVLVSTGTNPVLLFGKTLIKSGKVPEEQVLYFFEQVPFHVKEITQTLLDEGYALCKDNYIVHRPRLYTACYLTLANIIHDRCVARYHPEGEHLHDDYTCPDDVPVTFFQEISKKYEESDDEYRKIAYITALGRLGVKESLRYLRHYVEGDAHQNLLDRTNAIYALNTIARRYPELVRELIIPLYYNTTEHYEVRLAAFNVLLQTHPELYELETIARNLIEEEDDQVRSYVYSAFRAFDNSTYPCDRKLARDVRYALHILKPHRHEFDYDYSYSHVHYASGFNQHYDYGGSTMFSYLASDTGYIPRCAYLKFNDFIRGKDFDTFAVGFRQYGLEKFTDKLFGPDGAYGRKSFFDLFQKRKTRDVSNTDKERREIQEKLHLPIKDYGHVDGEIFFTYMGNHFSFMYFNDTTFESFFRDGAFEIPDVPGKYRQVAPYRYKRFVLPVDYVYILPSESGLPIMMDFKESAYFYHRNDKLKLEVNPAFFKDDRQDHEPTDLHVDVEGHFIFDKQFIGTVGVVQPLDHTTFGAGVEKRCTVSLPIKLDVAVDIKESKVKVQWKPVVPHQIYHYEFEPYTFIDSYEDRIAVVEEEEYRPVRRKGYHQQISKEFDLAPFGLHLHLDKDYDSEWNDYGSLYRFLVRTDYREKYYYLMTNPQLEPYECNVTLEDADGEKISEVDATFSYHFYRNENQPKSRLSENGFEDHGPSRTDKNLMTSVIRGEIEAHGGKDRKVQAEITYSRDIFRKYHKLHLYYDRTPFFKDEHEHFKVCVSGYLKYPHLDTKKLESLETHGLERTVETEVKTHFGKDCTSDEKFTIHGKFEVTEEQLYLDEHREEPDTPEHYNPYAYLYQKCLRDRDHGDLYPDSCFHYMHQAISLNKYSFHVTYEHLSPRFLNFTHKLGRFIQHELYDYSDNDDIDVHNPDNEYHIEANVSAIYPVADIRVRRPRSESEYTHVYLPHYKPFLAYPVHQDAMTKKSLNDHECYVMGDILQTFDNYRFVLPQIDCYKVIAKDCSPHKSFIVLGSKIQHSRYEKAVKVILGKHKVEILPHSEESDLIIRVDGKKVAVAEHEPYYHYEGDNHDPLFFVARKEFYYAIHSEHYGLIVEYDGHFIAVKVSPYYRAKLCGLCGNYNGQMHDGYKNEKGCIINDDQAYAYSFAIPTESCAVPKVEFPCYGEEGAGCTELRTEALQFGIGNVIKTCFSVEPVPHCREGCVPETHHTRTLHYHCLPAEDDSTENLLQQRKHRVLYEVRRKSKDHEAKVEVPEGCHRP